ncbi:MAG: hypothetical protein MUC65_04035, partial [Pontiellaceae bacterium]|nr:hypothetical protein [Pontiellaceae bacterium]
MKPIMKLRKQLICTVFLFLVFSPLRSGFAAYSPVLTLTETNGALIEGPILSYSPKTDCVKVKTKEGPVQRPLSALTEESRKTLDLWQEDQDFLKDSKLTVEFTEKFTSSRTNVYGTLERSERKTVIGYANRSFCSHKIKLTSQSDYSFKDLQIECRV